MRSFQTVPKWRQLSNKPEKIERDPEKLAKKAPDWMGFSAEDIATQQRLLASDKARERGAGWAGGRRQPPRRANAPAPNPPPQDDSAAAVPARVRKRRESHAGSERLAAASAARVRKTELLVARVVGPKGEPNYTAFATGQPQWWGVKVSRVWIEGGVGWRAGAGGARRRRHRGCRHRPPPHALDPPLLAAPYW